MGAKYKTVKEAFGQKYVPDALEKAASDGVLIRDMIIHLCGWESYGDRIGFMIMTRYDAVSIRIYADAEDKEAVRAIESGLPDIKRLDFNELPVLQTDRRKKFKLWFFLEPKYRDFDRKMEAVFSFSKPNKDFMESRIGATVLYRMKAEESGFYGQSIEPGLAEGLAIEAMRRRLAGDADVPTSHKLKYYYDMKQYKQVIKDYDDEKKNHAEADGLRGGSRESLGGDRDGGDDAGGRKDTGARGVRTDARQDGDDARPSGMAADGDAVIGKYIKKALGIIRGVFRS